MSNIKVQKSNGNETYNIQKVYAYYAENAEALNGKTESQLSSDILNNSFFTSDKIIDTDLSLSWNSSTDSELQGNVYLPSDYNFSKTIFLCYEFIVNSLYMKGKSSSNGLLVSGFPLESSSSSLNSAYTPRFSVNSSEELSFSGNLKFYNCIYYQRIYSIRAYSSKIEISNYGTIKENWAKDLSPDMETGFITEKSMPFFCMYQKNYITNISLKGHLKINAVNINL